MPQKQRIYDYFSEFASEALHIVIFENFIKSMTSCLLKLKVTPSFCFPFEIRDNPTTSNAYRMPGHNWIWSSRRLADSGRTLSSYWNKGKCNYHFLKVSNTDNKNFLCFRQGFVNWAFLITYLFVFEALWNWCLLFLKNIWWIHTYKHKNRTLTTSDPDDLNPSIR